MEGTRGDKTCYHHREDFAKEPLPKEKGCARGRDILGRGKRYTEDRDLGKRVTFSE